jgi:hypothetical protein
VNPSLEMNLVLDDEIFFFFSNLVRHSSDLEEDADDEVEVG